VAASRVFGQGDSFTTGLANNGGVSANSLNGPEGVAAGAQGDVYVADPFNNRVLEYDTSLSHNTTANREFGQTGFARNPAHSNSNGANNLDLPSGAALEAPGHLFVADSGNNRVLEYFTSLANGRGPRFRS
jgi:hypothetical protein